ncbi:MAG: hypothetical protein EOO88_22410, partial [Pedobacter sp.]
MIHKALVFSRIGHDKQTFVHYGIIAEGISTLQWLVMDGKPADVVAEMIGGAQIQIPIMARELQQI